jgi:hypothetical protein
MYVYIPNFKKIGLAIQKKMGGGGTFIFSK